MIDEDEFGCLSSGAADDFWAKLMRTKSRLVERDKIFTNCNVCGIKLRTKEEDQMGMCERCAAE